MDTNPPEPTHDEIEMPAPSFWPIVLAFGLLLIAVGVLFSLIISLVGIIILLVALVGWTLENRAEGGDADDIEDADDLVLAQREEEKHG
jgi:hypothetical protein